MIKEDIRTLADELRKSISAPKSAISKSVDTVVTSRVSQKKEKSKQQNMDTLELISLIQAFDCSANKHMLHPRFDSKTIALLNSFKLTTGIEMNRVISFSIDYLFQNNPQLKTHIKNTLNNLEL